MRRFKSMLLLAMTLTLATCCSQKESISIGDKSPFSLSDAQSVFQREIVSSSTRSASKPIHRSKLSPGGFTPIWEDAESFRDGEVIGYIVPIQAEFNIYSYKRTPDNIIHRPWRKVRQELVISRDLASGKESAIIKSTIKRFGLKTTEKFSGVVAYTLLDRDRLIGVKSFVGGEMVDDAMPGTTVSGEVRLSKIMSMLAGYSFAFKRNTATRSGDDEDDPWWEDDLEGFEYLGGGIFIDEDGHLWFDTDLDGIPDQSLFPPEEEEWDEDDQAFYDSIDWDAWLQSGFNYLSEGFILGDSFVPGPYTRLASSGLPSSGPSQQYSFANASFLSAYVYADMFVGDSTYTQPSLLSEYMETYSVSQQTVMSSGLAVPFLKLFTQDIFSTTEANSVSEIKSAINNGNIVLMSAKEYSGQYHALVIVGYNTSNDCFIYVYGDDGQMYEENPDHLAGVKKPGFILTGSTL